LYGQKSSWRNNQINNVLKITFYSKSTDSKIAGFLPLKHQQVFVLQTLINTAYSKNIVQFPFYPIVLLFYCFGINNGRFIK